SVCSWLTPARELVPATTGTLAARELDDLGWGRWCRRMVGSSPSLWRCYSRLSVPRGTPAACEPSQSRKKRGVGVPSHSKSASQAPPVGLEPTTLRLTAECSAN